MKKVFMICSHHALVASMFLICSSGPSRAEDAVPTEAQALKYYSALEKRPAAGYLFDRFYNAWLDLKSSDELEKFLLEKAAAPGDAASAARTVLGLFYARQGQPEKALAEFAKASTASGEILLEKAAMQMRLQRVDDALKDVESAIATKPAEAVLRRAMELKGKILARSGKPELAAKVWQELVALFPADDDLREDLIERQVTEGLWETALKSAQELLEKTADPYKKVERRMRVGDILSNMDRREDAVAEYKGCLEVTGSDSWLEKEILGRIEQLFRRTDSLDKLIEFYNSIVTANPQRLELRKAQTRLWVERGEVDKAIAGWREMLALAPGDGRMREGFVQLLSDADKVEDAIAQAITLKQQEAENPEHAVRLSALYSRAGKSAECLESIREFLKIAPPGEQSLLRAAALAEQYQLKDDAVALCKEARQRFPDSEGVVLACAGTMYRAGQKEDAIAMWKELAGKANPLLLQTIARTLSAQGENVVAEEVLRPRLGEFQKDAAYLQLYCEVAVLADKKQDAVQPSKVLLNLADAGSLEGAVTLLIKTAEKAGILDSTIQGMVEKGGLSTQETCLVAEWKVRRGDVKGAMAVLDALPESAAGLRGAAMVKLLSSASDFTKAAEAQLAVVNSPEGMKSKEVLKLITLYQRAGKFSEALNWVSRWKGLSPGATAPSLMEAELLMSLGKSSDALRVLKQASMQFPGDGDVQLRLGSLAEETGQLAEAERIYTTLYEKATEAGEKVRLAGAMAKIAQQQGRLDELLDAFAERRKGNAGSIVPLLATAEIHRVSGNAESRRAALVEANRLKKGDLDLLMQIAKLDEQEGRYEESLAILAEAKTMDKSGKVTASMVRLLYAVGREEEATKLFQEGSIGSEPDARDLEELMLGLTTSSYWEEIVRIASVATKRFPADYRLGFLHAWALEETDQSEKAALEYARLLTIHHELPEVLAFKKAQEAALAQGMQNKANSRIVSERTSSRNRIIVDPNSPAMVTDPVAKAISDMQRMFSGGRYGYDYDSYLGMSSYSGPRVNGALDSRLPVGLEFMISRSMARLVELIETLPVTVHEQAKRMLLAEANLPAACFRANGIRTSLVASELIEDALLRPEDPTLLPLATTCSLRAADAVKLWSLQKSGELTKLTSLASILVNDTNWLIENPTKKPAARVRSSNQNSANRSFNSTSGQHPEVVAAARELLVLTLAATAEPKFWALGDAGMFTPELRFANSLADALGRYFLRVQEGAWLSPDGQAFRAMAEQFMDRFEQKSMAMGERNDGSSFAACSNYLLACHPERLPALLDVCAELETRVRANQMEFVGPPEPGSILATEFRIMFPRTNDTGFPISGVTRFTQNYFQVGRKVGLHFRVAPGSGSGYGSSAGAPVAEHLRANQLRAAEIATNPWVKAALLAGVDIEKADAIIKAQTDRAEVTFSELRFAAAWAREQFQPERCVQLLERAREICSPIQQHEIDGYIVSLGCIDEDANGERGLLFLDNDVVAKAVTAAANRLAAIPQTATSIQALSNAMLVLGMNEESVALNAKRPINPAVQTPQLAASNVKPGAPKPAASPIATARKQANTLRYSPGQDLVITIKQLQAHGRKELAAKLVMRKLQTDARTAMRTSSNGRGIKYNLMELINESSMLGEVKKLLAAERSADGSPQKLQRQIWILSNLQANEEAIAVARQLLAVEPGNFEAKRQLFLAARKSNLDEAMRILESSNDEDWSDLFAGLDNFSSSESAGFRRLLAFAGSRLKRIPEAKRPEYTNWISSQWVRYAFYGLPDSDSASEEIKALREFATVTVEIPSAAQFVQPILTVLGMLDSLPVEELIAMNQKALVRFGTMPNVPYQKSSGSMGRFSLHDPLSYLVLQSAERNDPAILTVVQSDLRKLGNSSPLLKEVDTAYDLYFGTADAVKARLKTTPVQGLLTSKLLASFASRKMDPGVADLYEKLLRQYGANGSSLRYVFDQDGPSFHTGVIRFVYDSHGPDEAGKLLRKLMKLVYGSYKDRKFDSYLQSRDVALFHVAKDEKDLQWQFFQTKLFIEEVLRFVGSSASTQVGGLWRAFGKNPFQTNEPAQVVALLKASPFLGELPAIDPVMLKGSPSLLADAINELVKLSASNREAVRKEISAVPTLGSRLIAAMLSKPEDAAKELPVVLKEVQVEFKKFSPQQLEQWSWFPEFIKQKINSKQPELVEMQRWLDELVASQRMKVAEESIALVLNGDSWSAAKLNPATIGIFFQETFPLLLSKEPAKAAALLKKLRVITLTKFTAPPNSNSGSQSEPVTLMDGLVKVMDKQTKEAANSATALQGLTDLIKVVLESMTQEDGVAISHLKIGDSLINSLSPIASEEVEGKSVRSYRKLLDWLDASVPESQSIFLLPTLERLLIRDGVHDDLKKQESIAALCKEQPSKWSHVLLQDALDMRMRPHEPYWIRRNGEEASRKQIEKLISENKPAEALGEYSKAEKLRCWPLAKGIGDPKQLPHYQIALLNAISTAKWSDETKLGLLLSCLDQDESIEPPLCLVAARLLNQKLARKELVAHQMKYSVWGKLVRALYWPAAEPLRENEIKEIKELAIAYSQTGPDVPGVPELVEYALKSGDMEFMGSLLQAQAKVGGDAQWLARIVSEGRFGEAEEHARRLGAQTALSPISNDAQGWLVFRRDLWGYSSQLHEQLPKFLDSVAAEPQKWVLRAALESLPDLEVTKLSGLPDRVTRLTKLAEEFAKTEVVLPAETERAILACFSALPKFPECLGKKLVSATKDLTFQSVAKLANSNQQSTMIKLLRKALVLRISTGDAPAVFTEITTLMKNRRGNYYNELRAFGSGIGEVMEACNLSWEKWDKASREANRAFWIAAVTESQFLSFVGSQGGSEVLVQALFTAARDDKMEEMSKAFQQVSGNSDMFYLLERYTQTNWTPLWDQIKGANWPENEAERLKAKSQLAKRVLHLKPILPGVAIDPVHFVRKLIQNKVLLEEDFLAEVEALLKPAGEGEKNSKYRGLFVLEAASLLHGQKRNDEALVMLKRYDDFRDSLMFRDYMAGEIERAELLVAMKLPAEALKAMKAVAAPLKQKQRDQKDAIFDKFQSTLESLELRMVAELPAEEILAKFALMLGDSTPRQTSITSLLMRAGEKFKEQDKMVEAADCFALGVLVTQATLQDPKPGGIPIIEWLEAEALARPHVQGKKRNFISLIENATEWTYLDNGLPAPLDWKMKQFDDSAWLKGKSPLGYGDPGMGKEILPGGTGKEDRAITAHFRKEFEVKDLEEITSLHIKAWIDDGCVVYLNGVEIWRDNLPEGEITPTTHAVASVKDGREDNRLEPAPINAPLPLELGRNVISAEVHQETSKSSDLRFELQLKANVPTVSDAVKALQGTKFSEPIVTWLKTTPESFRKLAGQPE